MIKIKHIAGYMSVILLLTACRNENMDENQMGTSVNAKSTNSNLIVDEKAFDGFIKNNDLRACLNFIQ
ncbi:hypothetical protein CHRY9393_03592 [Chryseobacterium fistulae]|uniref:Uncharacterized protein n=2 Tax=Chryseobacterium fistulae TaxID=2675058 RepID=A0A6N4XTN5_9FLAO|nr:hypothetical protein CHRY9393_03592 [Chryseobacterium fistulae]